jgi:hypothetical protein
MVLWTFSSLFWLVSLSITSLVINQYQSAPVTQYSNLNPTNLVPSVDKYASFVNRSQNLGKSIYRQSCLSIFSHFLKNLLFQLYVLAKRFRCLKGWEQFGGSCYYPSIMQSTADQSDQTCRHLYVNNTNLMRIRHFMGLFYAAHIFSTNNLTRLLIEVDPRLLKSKI